MSIPFGGSALGGQESTAAIVRALCLFGPLLAVIVAARCSPPPPARIAAAILSSALNLAVLPAVNLLAVHLGWWNFQVEGAAVDGLPVDLMLGWVLLWGTLPALLPGRLPLVVTATALVWLDVA